MFSKKMFYVVVVIAICLAVNVFAVPINVGEGVNSAYLFIEWSGGFVGEFNVSFGQSTDETITGLELFDIIEDQTPIEIVRLDFGWGVFIDGIVYENHVDVGWQGGEDWWHHWIVNQDTGAWEYGLGASDRIIADGYSDGWIYGHDSMPVSPKNASNTIRPGWIYGNRHKPGSMDMVDEVMFSNFNIVTIPEPASIILLALGGLFIKARRR